MKLRLLKASDKKGLRVGLEYSNDSQKVILQNFHRHNLYIPFFKQLIERCKSLI